MGKFYTKVVIRHKATDQHILSSIAIKIMCTCVHAYACVRARACVCLVDLRSIANSEINAEIAYVAQLKILFILLLYVKSSFGEYLLTIL